jgi:Zn finger protein HypA/HybF involved in hydrogenase expression
MADMTQCRHCGREIEPQDHDYRDGVCSGCRWYSDGERDRNDRDTREIERRRARREKDRQKGRV